MPSVNKAILIGHLGKDPEKRAAGNGDSVVSFSLATSERWTDKASGEKKEHTEWHNVTVWRALADIAFKYLKKGSLVYVEGKLQTRSWLDDKAGVTRYSTGITATELRMLSKREDDAPPAKASKPPIAAAKPAPIDDDDVPF